VFGTDRGPPAATHNFLERADRCNHMVAAPLVTNADRAVANEKRKLGPIDPDALLEGARMALRRRDAETEEEPIRTDTEDG
jgi:hypothetical protein